MSDLGGHPPSPSSGPQWQSSESEASFAQDATSDDRAGREPQPPGGPDALAEALRHLAEAREYLVYLIAVQVDRLRLQFRRAASFAILAIAGLAILVAILMTAAGLLLWGLADLISRALGQATWVGALIVGGGVLVLGIFSLAMFLWAWHLSAYNALRRRYAKRRSRQRELFGRSVDRRDDSAS